ncbi:serine hydrolase domain-containing protein [Ilumatobacter sp.]|uniref:serine hydrolase domain-containing protein n=1 Tax=Ilumatobacter sp. TaxID=1967498 RepID=UPI003AF6C5EF
MTTVHGHADDGFGEVADAFEENFRSRGELGAAFCLYVDGVPRVDLWAGVANNRTGRSWDERTLALVFSTTKGATAICVAQLVQDGLLSYDDPVAKHWPEFAAAGKSSITVDQVMSHQAGLIGVEGAITFDEIMAVTPVVESLQRQAPEWPPGSAHGYHALTYGWLAGELVARVDRRRIGRYFADEVAAPLGLDFWIGLPQSEEDRVARLRNSPLPTDPAELERMAEVMGPGTNVHRAVWLDGRLTLAGENHFNSRAVHATEMPAANGITDARSLARMYAATIGEVEGVRLLDRATMNAARTQRVVGPDRTLVDDTRFGAGFWLHHESTPMIQDGSFGHPGAGGSLGYANPELGIGYGYVMNQMGGSVTGDPRTIALNDAVVACL